MVSTTSKLKADQCSKVCRIFSPSIDRREPMAGGRRPVPADNHSSAELQIVNAKGDASRDRSPREQPARYARSSRRYAKHVGLGVAKNYILTILGPIEWAGALLRNLRAKLPPLLRSFRLLGRRHLLLCGIMIYIR
jgi:hypothetical protein